MTAIALATTAFGQTSVAPARPNILFIMTDDHSSNAMSCYGSKVNQTPFLDRLASEGVRLEHCYATNAICSPSRASILTGKYSHLNGVRAFDKFDGSQPTVAKLLQGEWLPHPASSASGTS